MDADDFLPRALWLYMLTFPKRVLELRLYTELLFRSYRAPFVVEYIAELFPSFSKMSTALCMYICVHLALSSVVFGSSE